MSRISLIVFLFFGILPPMSAQSSFEFYKVVKETPDYSIYTAIIHEGNMLAKEDRPDGLLIIEPGTTGKLSVAMIDKSNNQVIPGANIGFRVAIKNYQTHSLWMYSEDTLFEVDLEEILNECKPGDTLIFMTVDRKYRLPRYEIGTNGC